jgi:hypothetical protein
LNSSLKVQIGWWALIALTLVGAISLYSDIGRFENPTGDRYFGYDRQGQSDFTYPYLGARSLLAGVNPYHHNRPELDSPIYSVETIDGVAFKQLYPPSHLLLFVPLAHWCGEDWQVAARVWFHVLLVALAGLSITTWALVRRITRLSLAPVWVLPFALCLFLNCAVEFCLERGQSDILTALFCWGALLSFLRRRIDVAVFLTVCGTCIKGYPILFALGLGLLTLRRGFWLRALWGGLLGLVVSVLPVAQYLQDGIKGATFRADMFWPVYFNVGFRNVTYYFRPEWADDGRKILCAAALCVTILAWLMARRAVRRGSFASEALWLTVFTTASLGTMISYSALSVSYNLILILPGVLVIVACQKRLGDLIALPNWARHLLGAASLCLVFGFWTGKMDIHDRGFYDPFPLTGLGLLLLFVILAPVLIRARFQSRASIR